MDGLDVFVRDRKCYSDYSFRVLFIIFIAKDKAFAAKHLPDLGHAVKEFKAYTWKVTKWKNMKSKLRSPEFDCGGHRWSVPSVACINYGVSPSHWLSTGAFSSFPLETLPQLQIPQSHCTLIVPTPRKPQGGMHVLNSHSSSQIPTTQAYTPSCVSAVIM